MVWLGVEQPLWQRLQRLYSLPDRAKQVTGSLSLNYRVRMISERCVSPEGRYSKEITLGNERTFDVRLAGTNK